MSSPASKNHPSSKYKVVYKQSSNRPIPPKRFTQAQIRRRKEAIDRATKKSVLDQWKVSDRKELRLLYGFFNGIWIGVMTIGGFIAWLISFLLV